MKKFVLPVVVLALCALALAPTSVAETRVGVKLEMDPDLPGVGHLSVVNAEGMKIRVFTSTHDRVVWDVVPAPYWVVEVPVHEPDVLGNVLYVKLPGIVFAIGGDESDWIWE